MTLRAVLLGSGSGPDVAASVSRCGAAVLVEAGPDRLLFDCGRRAAEQIAEAGYSVLDIDRVFFTHLHSGHTVGYPNLVLSSWVGGLTAETPARTDFRVYGPAGIRHMTDALFGRGGAFKTDLRGMADADLARREFSIHRHRATTLEWPAVSVTEITELIGPGVVVSTLAWQVRACLVSHAPSMPCLAYRVDCGGRSVVIGGDGCPSEGLISMARGADVLIHEGAWFDEQLEARDLTGAHTSAAGVARIAAAAGVRRLVVTAIPRVNDDPATLARIEGTVRLGFGGEATIARDLLVVEV